MKVREQENTPNRLDVALGLRIRQRRLVDIAHALDCRVVDLIGDLDDANIPSPLFRQDTAHLRESGAPELLAAYAAAPPALRRVILKLVVEIAKDQHAHQAEGANAASAQLEQH